jgi:hypothetical protein
MENAYGGGGGGNGYGGVQFQPMPQPYIDQQALQAQMLAQQQAYVNQSQGLVALKHYNDRVEHLRNENITLKNEINMLREQIKKGGELLKSRKKARHKMKMPRFFRFLFYIVIVVFVAKVVWSTNVVAIANYFFPPHSQQVQVIHDKCPVVSKK